MRCASRICYAQIKRIRKMDEELEKECIQCGKCGGVCPIGHVRPEITPRKTLFRIARDTGRKLEKDKDELWMCVTCYGCDEVCPQGIKVVNVMFETRNHLCRSGEMPGSIVEMVKTIKEEGIAVPSDAKSEKLRLDLGLGGLIKPDVRELSKISNL